ncbi:MAG: hypothetical protein HY763_09515 [Planctomycetes bacterium]|nr:hypothetical protein [Planctomycetota bacterium]
MMRTLLGFWFLLGAATVATAEDKPASDGADGAAILRKAQEAAKKVETARYAVEYRGTGWLSARVPATSGEVIVADQSKWNLDKFWCRVKVQRPQSEETVELTAGSDGEVYFLIDPRTKKAHEDLDPAVMGQAGRSIQRVVMGPLTAPEPFKEELTAKKIELREPVKVGDEDCYAVYVAFPDEREMLWYISKKDYLPRRFDRLLKNDKGEPATTELIATNLVVNPKLEGNPFRLALPEGYTKTDEFAN